MPKHGSPFRSPLAFPKFDLENFNTDEDGTPLPLSPTDKEILSQRYEAMQRKIAYGFSVFSPTAKTSKDKTESEQSVSLILHRAVWKGNMEDLMKFAKPTSETKEEVNKQNANGYSALHLAALRDNIAVLKMLFENFGITQETISSQDYSGSTALHHAVLKGNVEAVELLLAHGARPDIRNNDSSTALHHASRTIKKDDTRILELLLGVASIETVNSQDRFGDTPLHLAVLNKDSTRAIEILIAHGADTTIRTKRKPRTIELETTPSSPMGFMDLVEEGQTPIEYAVYFNNKLAQEFFQKTPSGRISVREAVEKLIPREMEGGCPTQ